MIFPPCGVEMCFLSLRSRRPGNLFQDAAGQHFVFCAQRGQDLKTLTEAEQMQLAHRYTRKNNRWVSSVGTR